MKIIPSTLALLAFASTGLAQEQPAEEIDFEARRQSIPVLEQHIAQREARFEVMREELRRLDSRVEEQLDYIIETLASITDSQESRRRVAEIKEDAIQSLMRNIEFYNRIRRQVFERMRTNPGVPQELSEYQLNLLDERMARRLGQVTELVNSLPGHRDVARYEVVSVDTYWDGWSRQNTQVSEEWRQNRRDARSSEAMRSQVLARIDEALQTAERRRAAITENLSTRQLDETERAAREGELGRLDAMIDQLRTERREITLPGEGGGNAVGRSEAHRMEQMLDDARRDLAQDFDEIVRRLRELDTEARRIHDMRENLAARIAWLEANAPPEE